MNNKFKKSIISFILCFFMLFSDLTSVTPYGNLIIPPLTESNTSISTNNSLLSEQVVINDNNATLTTSNNSVIINSTNNESINTTETTIIYNENTNVSEEVVQEIDYSLGTTVQAKIEPAYNYSLTRSGDTTITLIGDGVGADATVSFIGDEPNATAHSLIDYITRANNDPSSVGYCISPFYAGVKENKSTEVVVDENLTDKDRILLGIAIAGYPHNKYNISEYNSLSEENQYYATLIAIEHYLFQNPIDYPNKQGVVFNNDSWTHWSPTRSGDVTAQKIIEVAQQIYEKGVANPYNEDNGIATVNFTDSNDNQGTMIESNDNYILTIDINSDIKFSDVIIQFNDPIVKQWANESPTKIQFYQGNSISDSNRKYWTSETMLGEQYEGIHLQTSGTNIQLTIVIDRETANNLIAGDNGSYSLDYDTIFFGGNIQVALKCRNTNSDLQDYSVITTGKATARNSIQWTKNTGGGGGTPTPDTGKGGLKILKYNAKTNELVAGAIFKIRGISEDVYDFNVDIQASANAQIPILNNGATVTVQDGVITIENLEVGTYEITEITPPPNFDLALGQNSQTVQVESETNATLYPQIRFENNPYGSLKIKKVDAITGEALAGAVIKISNPLFDYEQEFTTNAQGLIEISNLKQGVYEITEVQAPDGYILSTEVKTATIKWGETTEITYENQPKTSLKITKIDSETGAKLNGAIFELEHTTSGARYTTSPTVNGVATIENLVDGVYVLTEVKAPTGYILDSTPQNIVIENNRVNEVTIKNNKKPSLTIIKRDIDTKEVLSNAKFEIWRAENNTTQGLVEKVGEYFTDTKGQITLNNLDYGWYCIKEVQAPTGYLLAEDNVKFVFLEPNQTGENTVTITFENAKKPTLTIIKRDIDTKEVLSNAKFEIWRAENNTTQGLIEKVGEYFTDTKGQIILNNLDYGWYCIKEVQAPSGYLLSEDNVKFVFLEPNKDSEIIFENAKKPNLIINKIGSVGKEPLQGAKFSLYYATTQNGAVTKIGDYITDENGQIIIPTGTLNEGWYKLQETQAPAGYEIQGTGTYEFYLNAGESKEITIENVAKSSIVIKKVDADTGEPLAGAHFSISIISDGNSSGTHGTTIDNVITNSNGVAVVTGLKAGGYIIEETKAPDGYVITEQTETVWLNKDDTSSVTVTFENRKNAGLTITKMDSITKEPLADAIFKVTDSKGQVVGTSNGLFRTDETGTIIIPNLSVGAYVVQEIQAPDGYVLDNTAQTVHIEYGKMHSLEFFNVPETSILIKKYDSETKQPLEGAVFKVTDSTGAVVGNGNGLFTTNINGTILVSNLKAGTYIVEEIKAPDGYILDNNSQVVEVKNGKVYTLDFYNKPTNSLIIMKYDAETKEPLADAVIRVEKLGNSIELIGEYRTDETGKITITGLTAGSYSVQEIQAPSGYILDNTAKTVVVEQGKTQVVELFNKKLAGLLIKVLDKETRQPIPNAVVKVTDSNGTLISENGNARSSGTGYFTTNESGYFTIPNLAFGTYFIEQVEVPNGYVLENSVKTVNIKTSDLYTVEILNPKVAGIQILKRDSQTGKPLAGAKFEVRKVNGELVGTNYVTDSNGLIIINGLEQGWYTVKEIAAPTGYALNSNAQNVEVKTDKYTQVVFENDKLGKITINKIDYVTRKPIANVTFKVTKENGEVIGEFTTNRYGEIVVNNLEPANYLIEEMSVPSGYALDKGVRKVRVETGSEIFVEWENYPLASLIIYKYDNKTNKPIANVEFEIFDSSNNSLGKVTTDSNGKITLNAKFGQGTYTIKETKPATGYVDESIVTTVDLKWGNTTTIEIANTPIFGQIEIHKIGENNNPYTGQLDGENLQGAEFTIYDKATGKEVTKVTTNYNGIARTGELPYGEYIVKETKAPIYYLLDETEYIVSITENGEVVKLEVKNQSVELKTGGEKSTVKETKAGDTIRYDFNNLQNLSTVALSDFYIHDSLPSAVTPTRLFTGTFNQNMTYKITYKTNMTSEFKVLQDNLFSNQVYEIDLTKGLQAGEYITDIRYEFDKVGVGFREVEKPFLYVKVNENVKKNEQFTNILTVGGRYDMQTVTSEDRFTTTVISSTSTFDGTLPKTGY